jgi:hypothetical protein
MRLGGAWLALAVSLAACTTNVAGPDVLLREKNDHLVRAHAVGRSQGVFLFCLIPLTSPTLSEAKRKLDDSVGETLEGRAIALTNRSIDRSSMNALLYSIETITLTADVIEFESPSPAKAAR